MTDPFYDYRPTSAEYAWTFGGVTRVRSITAGTRLHLWTYDAYAGRIRAVGDRVSELRSAGLINPQTGAHPVDTVAVHVAALRPARPYGAPGFGGLTGTGRNPTLQEPLPERVWIYDVDLDAATLRFQAHDCEAHVLPLEPMLGTIGSAGRCRGAIQPGTRLLRRKSGQSAGSRGRDLLPQSQRRGCAVLGRRRPLPAGEGRVVRVCCRGRDGRRADHQTPARAPDAVGARGERHLTGVGVRAFAGGGVAGRAPLANVVDPNYTATALIDKAFLPSAIPTRDVHGELREQALGGPVRDSRGS